MRTKSKLLLLAGIAITAISLVLGVWVATITVPTSMKIIECMRNNNPNQTFTPPDTQGRFEECAAKYPYDRTAGLVLGLSNLLFWTGIIIVVIAIIWYIRNWYVDRRNRSIRTSRRSNK